MDSRTPELNNPSRPDEGSDVRSQPSIASDKKSSAQDSSSSVLSWAKSLKLPQMQQDSQTTNAAGNSTFSRLASGLGLQISSKASASTERANNNFSPAQSGVIGSFTKGIVDSSLNAVKAVQVKARHMVSQNKRRYQEGGFDLDMTYITENIIAMGFPAGDLSSGLFGYFEGLYRNHMEEVIKFFETHHKGKYKVYNLCSERLYDASLFEGKVASFPFDDHNCPPIELIKLFCQSAYSWLKEDILNVVVVHCKAGKARTGLMICSLLLFLKFFPSAEECINYYNQQRCIDGKGLILPSQIRYVKYFERIMTQFNGETPPGRRCMLRGFRLHKCPYWVRPAITISNHNGVLFSTKKHPKTKDLMVELVMIDYDGTIPPKTKPDTKGKDGKSTDAPSSSDNKASSQESNASKKQNNEDDVFSDSEGEEESSSSRSRAGPTSSAAGAASHSESRAEAEHVSAMSYQTGRLSIGQESMNSQSNNNEVKIDGPEKSSKIPNMDSTDIKAIAADASVFSFGDDEDYESD
ncbi:phosphatidylinositol 3 4 5-trisphosphate 3-phosphatase and dual-specificity protein phosphatase pten [Phtheirospermum japonicum]|uniref:Phosphatidylinositol 3 4 5-trisphosphate 3-phosphatase and dual-specificity protein phosphatase pten n=1 Tax=Phtheirospermum japonicum TaxID=374723 RepID=A0A830CSJ6_9LAMI|nr:phosphatidylinositol 3 4 5-trisphosphate 3-phosphatase and dual-specificity protein phosphatase pten [Phtheirospermum japonicum]